MSNSSTLSLSVILRAVDRLSGPINAINARIEALHGPVRRLSAALNNSLRLTGISQITSGLLSVGSAVSSLTLKLMAMGGVAGVAFKRLFIDTAAEFENYEITLETFYGTSEKAKAAMDWVSGFAASTPYQLGEVTRGFIELKSFGLDPISGALKAAGDAAAAMGKPIDMATNTLASALRGQADMLDNFGIFGRIEKNMMVFDWVDKAGKKSHKEVNKTNRDLIAKTIMGIWEQKFGGSMDRLSHGYTGIVSNIMDNLTRLANKVMESGGSFSFLKDELQAVLDKLSYLQTPEGLKETERWGVKLRLVLGEIKLHAIEAWDGINELAVKVGGFGNLAELVLGGIAAIMAGPLLLALTMVTEGVVILSGALLALALSDPILLAIEAAVIGIWLLWKNWDAVITKIKATIKDIKETMVTGLMSAIDNVVSGIKLAFAAIVDGADGVIRIIKNIATLKNPFAGGDLMFPMPDGTAGAPGTPGTPGTPGVSGDSSNLANPVHLPLLSMGKPVPTLLSMGNPLPLIHSKSQTEANGKNNTSIPANNKQAPVEVSGQITFKIDQDGRGRVASIKSNNPRINFNVDAGLIMSGAR